jgi:hypothetical protein
VSTTVPAATGPKSQATGPEELLMLPLEGEAALPLPLGKTVNAAINPPTRIRREIAAQLDRTAMYGTPCGSVHQSVGSDRPIVNWAIDGKKGRCSPVNISAAWTPPSGQLSARGFLNGGIWGAKGRVLLASGHAGPSAV